MAINGLKKGDRQKAEQKAQQFIKGVNERTTTKSREKVYKPVTFSLNESCDQDINDLTYIPRDFKISRSGVIKAAIDLLKSQKLEDKIQWLRKYKD